MPSAGNQLAANAVANGKIQDGAVSSTKLAPAFLAQLVKNVSYVSKASSAVSITSPQTVSVVQMTESVPFVGAESKRTGWTAAAKTSEAGKTFAVEAVAICAEF
jgi:hypothetical protein